MNETERFAWLQLAFIPYIGAESFLILLQYFGSTQAALDAPAEKIAALVRHKQAAEAWRNTEKRYLAQKSAEAALKWEMQDGCRLMLLQDQDFPEMLTQGITAPPVLFLRGDAGLLHKYSAAIVGSRHATPQAMRIAKDFGRALSEKGIPVVSGMASGIDTAAHQGALQAGGGTIAVWGTGIDRIYPPSNKSLAYEIAEKGLIVSEFPLDTRPLAGNFPRRNRLIAALSQVTLVVEAAVIGYSDEKWGERPLAVTVLHAHVEPNRDTAEILRDGLREKLPSWMLPEYWTFVDSIDKTSVDKFDKKDLRKHLADGDFEVIKLRGPGEK